MTNWAAAAPSITISAGRDAMVKACHDEAFSFSEVLRTDVTSRPSVEYTSVRVIYRSPVNGMSVVRSMTRMPYKWFDRSHTAYILACIDDMR